MSSLVAENISQFSNVSNYDNGNSSIPIKMSSNDEESNMSAGKTNKIIHFCDGALEECNAFEDEKDGNNEPTVDPSTLSWGPWMLCQVTNAGSKTLQVVDYVGESLANFFGITTPKYQYEIDEYEIMCAEDEEEKKTEDLEMGGWTEGSSGNTVNQSKPSYSSEVAYDGPIKLQPNTVQRIFTYLAPSMHTKALTPYKIAPRREPTSRITFSFNGPRRAVKIYSNLSLEAE